MKNPLRFLGFMAAGFNNYIPIISLVIWILERVIEGWNQYKDNPPEKR